jgi:hypothetical protein
VLVENLLIDLGLASQAAFSSDEESGWLATQCKSLLPGAAMAARSYNRVMAEPGLVGARLVATLPGMAGAPITGDITILALARRAADPAAEHGAT